MKVEKITDVKVKIDILQPQPVIGMGIPAIFTESTAAGIKAYNSISALAADHAANTSVHKLASAIMAQRNAPRTIQVVSFEEGKIVEAAENHFYANWHFALLADFKSEDALALSNMIEEQEFKFLVVQTPTVAEVAPMVDNELTIAVVHSEGEERFDGALIGDTANLPVGSVTWKFRSNLIGITPQELTLAQLEGIHNVHAIAYIKKAGVPQSSEGTTLSGEFIDAAHGTHWVKSNIESNLQSVLSNTDKLSYDAKGIDLLNATVTNVLETAFQQGIVRADAEGNGVYTVTTLSREDVDPSDILARIYKGISFNYERSGAIHTIEVSGTVEV